jgi:hypothetical protein
MENNMDNNRKQLNSTFKEKVYDIIEREKQIQMQTNEIQFNIKNTETNVEFLTRIVQPGQSYGRDFCLTNESERTLVEFYDVEHASKNGTSDEKLGQFVSRYYLETLMDSYKQLSENGLCLDGGIPKWSINNDGMRQFYEQIHNLDFYQDPKESEEVTVQYTEWFFNQQGDKDFVERTHTLPRKEAVALKEELEKESKIADIEIIEDYKGFSVKF